jgi:hypothetical protein
MDRFPKERLVVVNFDRQIRSASVCCMSTHRRMTALTESSASRGIVVLLASAGLVAHLLGAADRSTRGTGAADRVEAPGPQGAAVKSAYRYRVELQGYGALADLDGDRRADLAYSSPQGVVNGAYRYRVDVHLTTGPGTTFDVDSKALGGLHISALDIDGDNDLDLVITSQFGREPVGVWINDGHGQFTQGRADSYAKGIWQETDRYLEKQPFPHPPAPTLANTAGGWVPQQDQLALLIHFEELRVAADYRALNPLNPGNPFRAPPLS